MPVGPVGLAREQAVAGSGEAAFGHPELDHASDPAVLKQTREASAASARPSAAKQAKAPAITATQNVERTMDRTSGVT